MLGEELEYASNNPEKQLNVCFLHINITYKHTPSAHKHIPVSRQAAYTQIIIYFLITCKIVINFPDTFLPSTVFGVWLEVICLGIVYRYIHFDCVNNKKVSRDVCCPVSSESRHRWREVIIKERCDCTTQKNTESFIWGRKLEIKWTMDNCVSWKLRELRYVVKRLCRRDQRGSMIVPFKLDLRSN